MAGNIASYCYQGEREDRNGCMEERASERASEAGRAAGGMDDGGPRRAPFGRSAPGHLTSVEAGGQWICQEMRPFDASWMSCGKGTMAKQRAAGGEWGGQHTVSTTAAAAQIDDGD